MLIEHQEEDIKRILEDRTVHNPVCKDFCKTQAQKNWKILAQYFQVTNHFNPRHLN